MAYALWQARPTLVTFAKAGLLHLACNIPLHNEDARRQFWPVSDWVFRSPFSYYDSHGYGHIIGLLEIALCLVFAVFLWRRFPERLAKALIVGALVLEMAPSVISRLMCTKTKTHARRRARLDSRVGAA